MKSVTGRSFGFASFIAILFLTSGSIINLRAQSSSPTVATLISAGATWRYHYSADSPGAGWRSLDFEDTNWPVGPAQLGYGDGDEATVIFSDATQPRPITAYFRRKFEIANAESMSRLMLRLVRDDGAIVYLNGEEVLRSNMPSGEVSPNTTASSTIGADAENAFNTFEIPKTALRLGPNVLAVEVHQVSGQSSDVSFDLELLAMSGTGDLSLVSIEATWPVTSEPIPNALVAPGRFLIRRTGSTTLPLNVYLRYEGTATPGVDYETLPSRVTILAGESSAALQVFSKTDDLREPIETVVARLQPPPEISIPDAASHPYTIDPARSSATVLIHDQDPLPGQARIEITRPQSGDIFTAGAPIVINATAIDPAGHISWVHFFSGNIRIGESIIIFDFQPPEPGTPIDHRFEWRDAPVGDHVLTARAVDSNGNPVISESVHIKVTPSPGNMIVRVTALDPEATELPSLASASDTARFQILRTGDLSHSTLVFYSIHGTANNGLDYRELRGPIEIPAGQSSVTLDVIPIPDALAVVEPMETVCIRLEPSPLMNPLPSYEIDPLQREAVAVIFETANRPPNGALEMAFPSSGARFFPWDNIPLIAAAFHPTQDITKVDFFANGTKIGESFVDPEKATEGGLIIHRFEWDTPAEGIYTITARATLSSGQALASSELRITVQGSDTPVVSIRFIPHETDEPWPDADFAPGSLEVRRTGDTTQSLGVFYRVSGTATPDADYVRLPGHVLIPEGQVAVRIRVEAKDDLIHEGEETVVVTLIPVPPNVDPAFNSHYVIDPDKASARIIILDNDPAPGNATLTITSPPNGAIVQVGNPIEIKATAVDPAGYIPRVEFYAGSTRIGVSEIVFIQPPPNGTPIHHSFVWRNAPAGDHVLTARAVDSKGNQITSPPVNIKVIEQAPVPVVRVVAVDPQATEFPPHVDAIDPARFVISRAGDISQQLTVFFSLHGTARNGSDYQTISDRVNIPAGRPSVEIQVMPIHESTPNGNHYQVVLQSGLPWEQARAQAEQSVFNGVHGHLATVTSAEEDTYIESLRRAAAPPGLGGLWLGGYQTPNQPSPTEGWLWINNEGAIPGSNNSSAYANWQGGEPNDYWGPQSENHLSTGHFNNPGWNDEGMNSHVEGYVVEYETDTVQTEKMETVGLRLEPRLAYTIDAAQYQAGAVIFEHQPPAGGALEIIIPSAGATYRSGEAVEFFAAAYHPSRDVQVVDYFVDGQKVGSSTVADLDPVIGGLVFHSLKWPNPTTGHHLLQARAALNSAFALASSEIPFVVDSGTVLPVVSIRFLPDLTTRPWPNADFAPGSLEVRRTGPTTAPLQVFYRVGGSATPDVDYLRLGMSILIPAGQPTAHLAVEAKDDLLYEGNETVEVTLIPAPPTPAYPVSYNIDPEHHSAAIVILDNESPTGDATLRISSPQTGDVFQFGAPITINAVAIDPTGYIGAVEFYDRETRIGVSVVDFFRAPDPGTPVHHSFVWRNAGVGDHILTARAIDSAGQRVVSPPVNIRVITGETRVVLAVEASDPVATEPSSNASVDNAVFVIKRIAGPQDVPVHVSYRLEGTAQNGIDYSELSRNVFLPAGAASVEVVVRPIPDKALEQEETVILILEEPPCITIAPPPPGCYLVGQPGSARAVIRDSSTGDNLPPVVRILRPQNGAIFTLGQTIEIRAEASDHAGTIKKLELFAGDQSLGSSASGALTATWTPQRTGEHTLRAVATDDDGATSSHSIRVLVREVDATAFVLRELPAAYSPGRAFPVRLRATPPNGASAYAVEDQPPAGWQVSAISHEGVFDAATRKVKFGPFIDDEARVLTYQLTPPNNAIGRYEFTGLSSANGRAFPIGGDRFIEGVSSKHPADRNEDNAIVLIELTAYAAAWKQGQPWSAGPVPIPMSYVTRAALLWKRGEAYRFDPALGAPPFCWVPASDQPRFIALSAAPSGSCERSSLPNSSAGAAIDLQISVTPPDGITSYALEEKIPEGWRVLSVSHDGKFDPATHTIRWGVFLDGAARLLTYSVQPPDGVVSVGGFNGAVSFDGNVQSITGAARVISADGSAALRLRDCQPQPDGSIRLKLEGSAGQVCVLEASPDLVNWTEISAAFLPDGHLEYDDHSAAGHKQRYYRVRLR